MDIPIWIKAVILGIVEGLTEFLPVSSTGHLIVVGKWLGFNNELFEVFIQMGALTAVWWLFRDRLRRMIPWGGPTDVQGRRLLLNVLIAFLPIMAVGIPAHHWIKTHLPPVQAIAWTSMGGGIVILLIERFKPGVAVENMESVTSRMALIVGLGQCLALCPGVSRSGATIMTGLVIGLSRSVATEFTFLLAVPTMSAATIVELWKYRHDLNSSMIGLLAIGFLVSYASALVVVKWFIVFVQSHTFAGFAWYRIVMGAALLLLVAKGFFSTL